MSDSIRERAHAKVNLALRIIGAAGGMHRIETLQQSVDLYDEVLLEKSSGNAITSDYPQDNSVVVLSALQRAFHLGGMRLSVTKRIPVGGGLGGSSADAAAAAIAAIKLYDLDPKAAFDTVKGLFGDIAFQMTKGTAITRGIGSEVESLPSLPTCSVLLAFPSRGISTRDAYALSDECPLSTGSVRAVYDALMQGKSAQEYYFNDLLLPAMKLSDEIAPLLKEIADPAALLTGMSGSGSTLFSLYRDAAAAQRQAARLSVPTLVTSTFCGDDAKKA